MPQQPAGWLVRILRISGIILGLGLVALVAGRLVEDARGIKTWNAYLAEQQTAGEPMLWQDFVPPEIPDEHNMATYPGLDLKALIALDSEAWPHQRDMIPRQAGWRAAQPWMLATQFEEGSVNSEEDAAQQLIGFFEQHRPLLDPLRNASARPQCRFELDYADPTLITLPINEIRAGIVAVFANSLASLHVSDSEAAAQDLVAGSRLVRHLDAAPSLVVAMVQIGLMDSALQITWEGLRNHAWDALQLEQIGSALSDWNLTARVLDSLRQDRAALFASLGGPAYTTKIKVIPQGWIHQNMVTFGRLLDDYSLRPGGKVTENLDYPLAVQLDAELQARRTRWLGSFPHPYDFFATLAMPSLSKVVARAKHLETSLTFALIAIDLEQTYLKTHTFPEQHAMPENFLYIRKEDGTPSLYHPGLNGQLDGATPKNDILQGDWVWQSNNPHFDPARFYDPTP